MTKEFEYFMTEDGSISLNLTQGEVMHSREGALTETLYIYLPVVEKVESLNLKPHYLCLGLGLGYIEWVTLAYYLASCNLRPDFKLYSYELSDTLRENFRAWLLKSNTDPYYQEVFEKVLELVAGHFNIASEMLFRTASNLLENGQWKLEPALELPFTSEFRASGIFYDAFSGKTDEALWHPVFLDKFLKHFAANDCVFATYACTGNLTRSLKAAHFKVKKCQGFGKKRESTFAFTSSESKIAHSN